MHSISTYKYRKCTFEFDLRISQNRCWMLLYLCEECTILNGRLIPFSSDKKIINFRCHECMLLELKSVIISIQFAMNAFEQFEIVFAFSFSNRPRKRRRRRRKVFRNECLTMKLNSNVKLENGQLPVCLSHTVPTSLCVCFD